MRIRLKQVVPVTGDFLLDDETIGYNCKHLESDTSVEIVQIKEGQLSIESEYDEAVNAAEVVRLCKKEADSDCDGIFVDCFGDPGVRAAREVTDVPVFGGFEPAVYLSLGLGDRTGILTVLENVIPLIEGGIARAKLGERVVSVRSVDIPVAELENRSILVPKLVEEAENMIRKDRVSVIVLGCTGMVDVAETVQKQLKEKGFELPVVEAAQAALNTLEMYAKMGLNHSRLTYMRPPEK